MKNRFNSHTAPNRKAFTLIEMLVVVVIMSTLLGIGAKVMKNATTAQGTDTGASKAESLFAEARELAKTSGSSVRVVIYKGGGTGEERAKHLRYMGIVKQVLDEKGTPDDSSDDTYEWDVNARLIARGVQLPSKVFFNAKLSGVTLTMPVQIPGFTGTQPCYYYEFNASGFLYVDPAPLPGSSDPYGVFVVQSGKLYPTDDKPKTKKGSLDVNGFAIWKRGNTTMFRAPSQIPSLDDADPKF